MSARPLSHRPGRGSWPSLVRARAGLPLSFVPFVALLGLVLVAPTITFLTYAFEHGLRDWSDFLDSPAKIDGVVRTLIIAAETTALCVVLGYVYAGALVLASPRWRAVLLALVVLPFLTSILVRTYGWIVILGNEGPINRLLRLVGGQDAGVTLLYNRTGLMTGMVHVMLPFFVLPLYAVWSQVPPRLRQASRSLGANGVETFLRVDLPLTVPGAAAGGILVFITSLGFFITPALLGGQGDVMVSQLIDRELTASVDLNQASVLATVLLGAVLAVVALFRLFYPLELLFVQDAQAINHGRRRMLGRRPVARNRQGRGRLALGAALNRLPWATVTKVGGGVLGVFFLLPLLVVVPISLTGESYLHFPPDSLSLRWFDQVIGDSSWQRAAVNSLITGTIATAIAFAVGMPLAFALVRSRIGTRVKGVVMLMATISVTIPLIVLALGIYSWYLDEHLLGNRLALAAAQAVLGLPFLLMIVMAGLRDFDLRLERASRSLGASTATTLRLITLPLVQRAIWAGLLFAFLQSFDELLIARAVSDVDTQTLPVKMWEGANEEISPALAAVSVLSLGVTLLGVAALAGVRRTRRRLP